MILDGIDGVDHINVYSKGHTQLGRWLSNFANSPIHIEHQGEFSSIEGYWYWLGTHDDRLRTLDGYAAKKLGKSLERVHILTQSHFEQLIKTAIDIKLKSDRDKLKEFAYSQLPFAHYYEYGKAKGNPKKVDAGFDWIIQHLEMRRKQLKQHWGIDSWMKQRL
jgi:hypothetical protein